MKKSGILFIISAPSGCGKTTLCKGLLKMGLGLGSSISATTRPEREGEISGRDYHFVSSGEFKRLVNADRFLEWTKTFGWYYGTPRKPVLDYLKKGKDVLLSIDVKGAVRVKRMHEACVLIFILPPSLKALQERIEKRKSDDKKEIEKRMKIVRRELSYVGRYDYSVVNDSVNIALAKLKAIVVAERCKVR